MNRQRNKRQRPFSARRLLSRRERSDEKVGDVLGVFDLLRPQADLSERVETRSSTVGAGRIEPHAEASKLLLAPTRDAVPVLALDVMDDDVVRPSLRRRSTTNLVSQSGGSQVCRRVGSGWGFSPDLDRYCGYRARQIELLRSSRCADGEKGFLTF